MTKTKWNDMLEFNEIIELLASKAVSERTRSRLQALMPSLKEEECRRWMRETTEARAILDAFGTPPLAVMKELDNILKASAADGMLIPEQLQSVARFAISCTRMQTYMERTEYTDYSIAYFGRAFCSLTSLREEIEICIRGEAVADEASQALRNIRRKEEQTENRIKDRLEGLLKGKRKIFTDHYISIKNGRYVLPVKKEYKNAFSGSVINVSSSGNTCFIEPESIRRLQEELTYLEIEEENEIHRILYVLTDMVHEHADDIMRNMDAMEELDFLFSKAKLSSDMDARAAEITMERSLTIKKGRHPLLMKDKCVPLDFDMPQDIRGVVITGPNTGGKTVALKTIGLLSLMAGCGLHIPCEEAKICMFDQVCADIGDGQSISENLSTFSSRLKNIIRILDCTTHDSLVLLDELGSGTDPAEGMGIAISVLEELKNAGGIFIATTHYPEVKEYAGNTRQIMNARMTFDKDTLSPLYQLILGEAGESCALYIAKRLGFPEHLLSAARYAAYGRQHEEIIPDDAESASAIEEHIRLEHLPEIQDKIQNTGTHNLSLLKPMEEKRQHKGQTKRESFHIGDSVIVYPQKEIGLVFQTVNKEGEIGVQIKKKKKLISYKRLKLNVSAEDMYPEDYDFSIVFDTVENRKARHQMDKKHRPDLEITYEEIKRDGN